jgi:hypothetical protein
MLKSENQFYAIGCMYACKPVKVMELTQEESKNWELL